MRSLARSYSDIVRSAAKNNSQLKRYIDEIDSFSDDSIERLPIQPYLRQGLREIRREHDQTVSAQNLEAYIVIRTLSSEMGEIRRWIDQRQFIPIERNNLVEIDGNELIWCSPKGFWFGSIFCHKIPSDFSFKSTFVKSGRKLDYMMLCREEIYRKHGQPVLADPRITNHPNLPGVIFSRVLGT